MLGCSDVSVLSASDHGLRLTYGEHDARIREAMNGMLSVNFKYSMSGSHWMQFSNDVVRAFDNAIFSGLQRVTQPSQVVCLLCNLCRMHSHNPSSSPCAIATAGSWSLRALRHESDCGPLVHIQCVPKKVTPK